MQAILRFFEAFFGMVRISDVLDIAILSFFIYKLIWATRKNSFGRVLKGVGVLLVMMALASVLKLYAVSYLFNIVIDWGVFALIVIFQPEIRRLLERVGDSRLFVALFSSRNRNVNVVDRAIRETVNAYEKMSKDKVGALMVFERQNHLDDVIKTGTTLDAAVSSELLKNLFWDKAPLHDGAVVVRNGRIIAAGCVLPLSGNENLSRDLGMRHRAGIGVSEHSDAVAVIVSEETGSISVAVGGMLKRHLAPETLTRLLENELLSKDEAENVNVLSLISSLLSRGKKGDEQDEEN
ncbi:MAG: TIGR00159 family protein [Ruminococcaceae bacterium]|nr:TIGR00159 family protein [Oscillospiraceae bacterium]